MAIRKKTILIKNLIPNYLLLFKRLNQSLKFFTSLLILIVTLSILFQRSQPGDASINFGSSQMCSEINKMGTS